MYRWIDGWMEEYMNNWIDEWRNEYIRMNRLDRWKRLNRWKNKWFFGWMDRWMNGCIKEWMNKRMNGWINYCGFKIINNLLSYEWRDGRMDEWMNGWRESHAKRVGAEYSYRKTGHPYFAISNAGTQAPGLYPPIPRYSLANTQSWMETFPSINLLHCLCTYFFTALTSCVVKSVLIDRSSIWNRQ